MRIVRSTVLRRPEPPIAAPGRSTDTDAATPPLRARRPTSKPAPPGPDIEGLPAAIVKKWRRYGLSRRSFGPDDAALLEDLVRGADAVVPLREAVGLGGTAPSQTVTLRHDTDSDIENSVRLAEWEAERGIRSTYFVQHTDWYWAAPGSTTLSPFLLRALERIQSLGHEIGIHNDAITAALTRGGDPIEILTMDIEAMRAHGFDVVGSASHGAKLCREVGYINHELFVECARTTFGDPRRTLEYSDPRSGETRSLPLRPVSMAQLGLRYEAYYLGHDYYNSDVRGRWAKPYGDVVGKFRDRGGLLQLLIHPVYWALSGEPFTPIAPVEKTPAAGAV
jgi:hypothetical protein